MIYVTVKPKNSVVSIQNKTALRCDTDEIFEAVAKEFFDEVMAANKIDSVYATQFEYQIFIKNNNKYYQLIEVDIY